MRVYSSSFLIIGCVVAGAVAFTSCNRTSVSAKTNAVPSAITVGTAKVETRNLAEHLTLSAELVPFQEIDVYAKEAGYVKELNVDYGTHVHKGQTMAVLEVPELEAQLDQDNAAIKAREAEVTRAEHDVNRTKAQRDVAHLQYERLAGVAKNQPGLVAQQEVDDAQGKDLAGQAQVEAAQGTLQAVQGELAVARAKLAHDQALFDYSMITAPFDGVVTQRYANLGALMQAGTTSTQATPLVRLSDERIYRLVIPVPETDVKYIHIGDPVEVRVSSLNKQFQGRIARFSVDLNQSTRTMHTEVDVPNVNGLLYPGLYADAVITLARSGGALVIPVQALNRENENTTVMIVNPDNRIETRAVTLGMQTPDFVQVTSGLRLGDQVVVSDRSGLRPGELVNAKPSQTLAYEGSTQH